MAFVLPSTWQNIVLVLVYSTIMNEKLIGEHANNKSSRELINSALSAWLNAYKQYYVQYWWIETSLWLARWSDKIIAIGWTVDVTIGRRVVKLVSTNKLWFSDRIITMKIVVESTISTIISSDFDKDLLYSSCSFIEVPCHTVLRVRPVNTPTVTIWRKYWHYFAIGLQIFQSVKTPSIWDSNQRYSLWLHSLDWLLSVCRKQVETSSMCFCFWWLMFQVILFDY